MLPKEIRLQTADIHIIVHSDWQVTVNTVTMKLALDINVLLIWRVPSKTEYVEYAPKVFRSLEILHYIRKLCDKYDKKITLSDDTDGHIMQLWYDYHIEKRAPGCNDRAKSTVLCFIVCLLQKHKQPLPLCV